MIDGRNFFYQKVKSTLRTYDNIRKTATGEGSDFTTGCYPYLIKYYKLIAIDLSKQKLDPKAIQQINVTGNLNSAEGATMFFIIEEAKETVLEFSKRTDKVLWFYFVFI